MKVKVKKEFEQIKEVLPLDYETKLVSSLNNWDTFVGANGETYTVEWIRNMVGYIPLYEIFEKV